MGCMSSKPETALAEVINNKEHWNKIKKRFIYGKSKYDAKQRDKLWDLIDLDRSGSLTYAEVERGAIRELELEKLLTKKQLTPILVRAFNAAKIKRKEKIETMFGVSPRPSVASSVVGVSGLAKSGGDAIDGVEEASTHQSYVFRNAPEKQSDLSSFRKGILKPNSSQLQKHASSTDNLTPPTPSQNILTHHQSPPDSSSKLIKANLGQSSGSGTDIHNANSSQQFISMNTLNTSTQLNQKSHSADTHQDSPVNQSTRISFSKGDQPLKSDAFGDDLEESEPIIREDGACNPLTAPTNNLTIDNEENKEIVNRNNTSSPTILRRKPPTDSDALQLVVSEPAEQHTIDTSLSVSRTTSTASKRKNGTSVSKLNLSAAQKERLHQLQREEFRLFLMYIADYMELFFAFQAVDSSGDNKVSLEEFSLAVPMLREWGVVVDDPAATFKAIDASGDGNLTFKEFSEWAIEQHMQVA